MVSPKGVPIIFLTRVTEQLGRSLQNQPAQQSLFRFSKETVGAPASSQPLFRNHPITYGIVSASCREPRFKLNWAGPLQFPGWHNGSRGCSEASCPEPKNGLPVESKVQRLPAWVSHAPLCHGKTMAQYATVSILWMYPPAPATSALRMRKRGFALWILWVL